MTEICWPVHNKSLPKKEAKYSQVFLIGKLLALCIVHLTGKLA